MYRHLRRLSVFTATLLISLSCPLQVVANTWGSGAALAQAQTTEQRRDEALRLNQLGLQQLNQGQFQEALKTFQTVLVIFRAIGDRQGEAVTLNNLGGIYFNQGQYSQALEYYQQALPIRQAIRDQVGEGVTLSSIGKVYQELGQYSQALKSYQQALLIRQAIRDQVGEGSTLYNMGAVYADQRQYPQALKYLQQALAIAQELGDKVMEGITLNNIGRVYLNQEQYPQALKSYQQALALVQEIGSREGEVIMLNNIGRVYLNQEQYSQALKSYQQALALAQKIGDRKGEGTAFSGIGGVYLNQGQYPKALEYYQQALAIAQKIGDRKGEGAILNSLGIVYEGLGQYAKSLEFYERTLSISQEVSDKEMEGTTLNNTGEVYRNLGQYSQALKFYNLSLIVAREVGDTIGKGITLNNIGIVYGRLAQYSEALKVYEQALVIFKEANNKLEEGRTLSNIGTVYFRLGQYSQALKFFEQALVLRREVGNEVGEAATLDNLGGIYQNLGQYPQALQYYQQALTITKAIGNRAGEGQTLSNIGGVYNRQGQYSQAETTLFAAIEVWESLRTRDLKDDQKVSIFDMQASTYSQLQNTLVAQNKSEQALVIAERSRARALVELLDSKLSENPNNQTNIKPPTLTEIQQIASQQNATLVQYSIINEPLKVAGKLEWQQSKLYIWVIKPTGEIAFEQVDLKKSMNTSLQELVTTSRQSIGVRGRSLYTDFEPTSAQSDRLKQLHKVIIEPIAQYLPSDPNNRVIFILQNELFLAPFPALQDTSGKYLIQKHTILTAPSIQVLQLTHEKRKAVSGNGVLVVGNPTMPKVTTKVGEASQQLTNLPGAEKEATTIAGLLNTKALTGKQATKAAVLPKLSNARIIHLATHGLLDDFKGLGVPGAIALAPDGTGELNDGLLTSNEIFDLKLNAELVVLSACDTGRGNLTGDGVIGLSRSLITAGVPSIIVSLWSVPDAPTASLMTQFYQNLQKNPDKAIALRQAMLATMETHPNPRDWAAFTLIGEAQ